VAKANALATGPKIPSGEPSFTPIAPENQNTTPITTIASTWFEFKAQVDLPSPAPILFFAVIMVPSSKSFV
jgi:hypothetical protein